MLSTISRKANIRLHSEELKNRDDTTFDISNSNYHYTLHNHFIKLSSKF